MLKVWLLLALMMTVLVAPLQQENQTYIAFVSHRELNDDIFITDQQGAQVFNLTQSRSRSWHPSWSHDGTQIAYNSDKDGNPEIYVMNANGTQKHNVSNSPASDTSPDWSPAADEIAFISDRDGGYDLYDLNLTSGETRRLTSDGAVKSDPDWSPDGKRIVFWQQADQATTTLNVLDLASGAITTLVNQGQNLWPAWSPDGRKIAYYASPNGSADIFTVDVASGEIANLTNDSANDARPDWSPDSSQIVFMSDRDGNYNLYLMKADGSGVHRLTTAAEDDTSASWQPAAAPIHYDPTALGQNVNIVQGNVSADAQQQLGAGERRLYAPETLDVGDVMHVRLEVDAQAIAENTPEPTALSPTPTLEIPLRSVNRLNLYRYMGAELTGLDLGRFDVFPDPTGYIIQVRTDEVNYWEWMLRPKGNQALGTDYLAARLYLPEAQTDGAIVRTELETVPFSVEVVADQPAEASALVSNSLETTEKQGFSVVYSDLDVFSVIFTNATTIANMTIANDAAEFPILGDFPIFQQTNDEVPANTCIYYEVENAQPVLPRACRSATNYSLPLVPSDVFWYDGNARQLKDVIIRKDGQAFICPASSNRCDF